MSESQVAYDMAALGHDSCRFSSAHNIHFHDAFDSGEILVPRDSITPVTRRFLAKIQYLFPSGAAKASGKGIIVVLFGV